MKRRLWIVQCSHMTYTCGFDSVRSFFVDLEPSPQRVLKNIATAQKKRHKLLGELHKSHGHKL